MTAVLDPVWTIALYGELNGVYRRCVLFLWCVVRELITAHPDNLATVLKHTIYNELSTARNPNNMAMISLMFQSAPDVAATLLAEIFQVCCCLSSENRWLQDDLNINVLVIKVLMWNAHVEVDGSTLRIWHHFPPHFSGLIFIILSVICWSCKCTGNCPSEPNAGRCAACRKLCRPC